MRKILVAPGAGPRPGGIFRWLLLAYAVLGAFVLLQPQPTVASDGVGWFHDLFQSLGAPDELTPARTEAVINAGLFAPAGAFAVLGFRRLSWSVATVASFVASMGVELFQGLFLEARTAQAIDVVANTSGGLVGALGGAMLLWAGRQAAVSATSSV